MDAYACVLTQCCHYGTYPCRMRRWQHARRARKSRWRYAAMPWTDTLAYAVLQRRNAEGDWAHEVEQLQGKWTRGRRTPCTVSPGYGSGEGRYGACRRR